MLARFLALLAIGTVAYAIGVVHNHFLATHPAAGYLLLAGWYLFVILFACGCCGLNKSIPSPKKSDQP